MATQNQQMSAAQVNALARAAIKARAVKMTQQVAAGTVNPANTPQVIINPRNVGLIKGFFVKVVHSINNGSAVQINATDLNAANALAQVQFNDLSNNTRIQTPGWHINLINSVKSRRPFGTAMVKATGFDSPINYGSNWTGEISCPATIAAAGNGTVTMWYWIPLAYSEDDLRGAIYANVVNATMQLILTFPGATGGTVQNGVSVCANNGADSTLSMFVLNAAGAVASVSITSTSYTVYQVYMDQLPTDPKLGVLLPILDLATIYELKQTTQSAIVANQDFPYQYANFRDFVSTVMGYVNNGTTGARGTGADINYLALQSANFTNIWKKEPALVSLETRNNLSVDLPPGFYYFGTREKPINTTQYGNMQLILNANTATNNPYQLVAVEDFAFVQTLSMAGSLPA